MWDTKIIWIVDSVTSYRIYWFSSPFFVFIINNKRKRGTNCSHCLNSSEDLLQQLNHITSRIESSFRPLHHHHHQFDWTVKSFLRFIICLSHLFYTSVFIHHICIRQYIFFYYDYLPHNIKIKSQPLGSSFFLFYRYCPRQISFLVSSSLLLGFINS